MITRLLDVKKEDALNGTTAVHMVALQNGAMILRAHDVREAVECVRVHQMARRRVDRLVDGAVGGIAISVGRDGLTRPRIGVADRHTAKCGSAS